MALLIGIIAFFAALFAVAGWRQHRTGKHGIRSPEDVENEALARSDGYQPNKTSGA